MGMVLNKIDGVSDGIIQDAHGLFWSGLRSRVVYYKHARP